MDNALNRINIPGDYRNRFEDDFNKNHQIRLGLASVFLELLGVSKKEISKMLSPLYDKEHYVEALFRRLVFELSPSNAARLIRELGIKDFTTYNYFQTQKENDREIRRLLSELTGKDLPPEVVKYAVIFNPIFIPDLTRVIDILVDVLMGIVERDDYLNETDREEVYITEAERSEYYKSRFLEVLNSGDYKLTAGTVDEG